MVRSKRIAADADPPDAQPAWLPSARFQLPADRDHRWLCRLLGATPWIVGCMALFAFYLRISFTGHVSSDGANSALQAMAPGARTHVRPRGYWNSSAITLESGNRVRVRAVLMDG